MQTLRVPITDLDPAVRDNCFAFSFFTDATKRLDKQNIPVTYREHLLYHYYGGCIYAACQMWTEAKDMFEIVRLYLSSSDLFWIGKGAMSNRQSLSPEQASLPSPWTPTRNGSSFNWFKRGKRAIYPNTLLQVSHKLSRTNMGFIWISLACTRVRMWIKRDYWIW